MSKDNTIETVLSKYTPTHPDFFKLIKKTRYRKTFKTRLQ